MEAKRQDVKQVLELKSTLSRVEEEKKQLHVKIDRLNRSIGSIKNLKGWFDVADRLRSEIQKRDELSFRMKEQQSYLHQQSMQVDMARQRLKRFEFQGGPESAIKQLDKELVEQMDQLDIVLPQEKEKLEQEIEFVHQILQLDNPQTAIEQYIPQISHLKEQKHELAKQWEKMSTQLNQVNALNNFKHQKQVVMQKKDSVQKRLEEATTELEEAKQESVRREQLVSMVKDNALKPLLQSIKDLSNTYKEKKTVLGEYAIRYERLQAEKETLLQQQVHMNALSENNERSMNENELAMVHQVEQLGARIQQEKQQVAPLIQAIKDMRKECQELEQDIQKKQSKMEKERLSMDSDQHRLMNELENLKLAINDMDVQVNSRTKRLSKLKLQKEKIIRDLNRIQQGETVGKLSLKDELEKDLKAADHTHQTLLQMKQLWNEKSLRQKSTSSLLNAVEQMLLVKQRDNEQQLMFKKQGKNSQVSSLGSLQSSADRLVI